MNRATRRLFWNTAQFLALPPITLLYVPFSIIACANIVERQIGLFWHTCGLLLSVIWVIAFSLMDSDSIDYWIQGKIDENEH